MTTMTFGRLLVQSARGQEPVRLISSKEWNEAIAAFSQRIHPELERHHDERRRALLPEVLID